MTKKIIAVFCVAILMASIFVACGKKPSTLNINGKEYLLVTDDEGNSIVNKDGDIAIYVKDKNNNPVKNENGENITNYIEFPEYLYSDNKIETKNFYVNIPEGYRADDTTGHIFVNGATNSHISFQLLQEFDDDDEGKLKFNTYVYEQSLTAEQILAKSKEQGVDAYLNVVDVEDITSEKLSARMIEFEATQKEEHYYSVNLYFYYNQGIYAAFYGCGDDTFDKNFDFVKFVNDNFIWK